VFWDNGRVVDKKGRDGDEDENDVQDTSRYDKSEVCLTLIGWEVLESVLLHAGSGFVPAVSGTVN